MNEIIGKGFESSLFLFSPICLFWLCILDFGDWQLREQAAPNYKDKNECSNLGDKKAWRETNSKLKEMEPLSTNRIWQSWFCS